MSVSRKLAEHEIINSFCLPDGWEILPKALRENLGDYKNAVESMAEGESGNCPGDSYWANQLKCIEDIEQAVAAIPQPAISAGCTKTDWVEAAYDLYDGYTTIERLGLLYDGMQAGKIPTPQPGSRWINGSERLPTAKDGSFFWVLYAKTGVIELRGLGGVAIGFAQKVLTDWMPTNLKRPLPPITGKK